MNGLRDTWTLTVRMLKHNVRSADTIVTTLVMPIMILLAFVFVLGGAMSPAAGRYVDYVVPVVLLFAVASGVAYTAWRVNQDKTSGIQNRLRTMPIARWSMTAGHVLSSVLVNAVSLVLMYAVALLVGYRPHTDATGWAASVGLLVAALVAFTMMGVACGLLAKTNEGAGLFSYLVMGLLFVSSGFAPTATMPAGLRAFADHQPMTPLIDALRAAQLGAVDPTATAVAGAWLAGAGVVFALLAAAASRRAPA
ncbi:MAG: ABC transporter permease [Propionibacteriaceae bacterium]|jgi:ABC-2 type transport system permease protein|nr:ABC transporter permease [Propionibacteriaceae bacterium]